MTEKQLYKSEVVCLIWVQIVGNIMLMVTSGMAIADGTAVWQAYAVLCVAALYTLVALLGLCVGAKYVPWVLLTIADGVLAITILMYLLEVAELLHVYGAILSILASIFMFTHYIEAVA